MATINQFEDIIAWQKDRELCKIIHTLIQKDAFSKDFRLVSQIKGSSGSIMDNIAEEFERGGNKEFIQFLYIAKGSAGETRSQLYRAIDNDFITKEEFENTFQLTKQISKLISGFIAHLKSSKLKGDKFN